MHHRHVAALGAGAAQAAPGPGPYFSAPFRVRTNPYAFGQAPSWTTTGGVLSNEPDGGQIEQVYSSRLNGSRRSCLTCGRLPGPNGFPAQRRQGHWILFCSVGVQPEHFGAPCLGGYGSDLYAIRPDGSDVTRLASSSDPAGGGRYDDRYMSLHGRSVPPQHPRVTHLTDDDPAYEEQAVFTPDMRDVIVMTSRARRFAADLYMVDVATRARAPAHELRPRHPRIRMGLRLHATAVVGQRAARQPHHPDRGVRPDHRGTAADPADAGARGQQLPRAAARTAARPGRADRGADRAADAVSRWAVSRGG
jgi:hypothetical protein